MGAGLTRDRIAALAPDRSALAASIKLQKPANWPLLGRDGEDGLVWGEFQGSGATPRRVMADLRDLGNKCACPSRKFPCKHVLALLWLACEALERFAPAETPPCWVGEWMARRRPKKAGGDGAVAADLLAWYDEAARVLPWRSPPGARADPYHVWLSEIMLQQTTVKAVIPYYRKFLDRWPTVAALARADIEAVMAAWAGLGYYSRARNLHACAKAVAATHRGRFPSDEASLLKLPGIGAYTAAAIAAIAFDVRATAVDGNVERVVARLFAVEEPLPASKPAIKAFAARLTPFARTGDFTQGMMDLGATICSPRSPSCPVCPVRAHCLAHERGIAGTLPVKAKKREKPRRFGAAFLAVRRDGAVLLRRRPPKGLLGGMLEAPSTDWGPAMPDREMALGSAPLPAKWLALAGVVRHTFTHFDLDLAVYRAGNLPLTARTAGCIWYPRASLAGEAIPSVMRKVLNHGLDSG